MKGCLRWLIPIVILLLWVALLMANLFATELPVFYQASANSLLSSLIVLAVSYWLVQARIDSRKDDDVVTNILNRAENSFKEYSSQVNCMMDAIEGTAVPPINTERQKMLSCKQKLDSHIDLLGKVRNSKEYLDDFKSLRSAIKKYHEKVEQLPLTGNRRIPASQKNNLVSYANKASTKFATLYVTINKH